MNFIFDANLQQCLLSSQFWALRDKNDEKKFCTLKVSLNINYIPIELYFKEGYHFKFAKLVIRTIA